MNFRSWDNLITIPFNKMRFHSNYLVNSRERCSKEVILWTPFLRFTNWVFRSFSLLRSLIDHSKMLKNSPVQFERKTLQASQPFQNERNSVPRILRNPSFISIKGIFQKKRVLGVILMKYNYFFFCLHLHRELLHLFLAFQNEIFESIGRTTLIVAKKELLSHIWVFFTYSLWNPKLSLFSPWLEVLSCFSLSLWQMNYQNLETGHLFLILFNRIDFSRLRKNLNFRLRL